MYVARCCHAFRPSRDVALASPTALDVVIKYLLPLKKVFISDKKNRSLLALTRSVRNYRGIKWTASNMALNGINTSQVYNISICQNTLPDHCWPMDQTLCEHSRVLFGRAAKLSPRCNTQWVYCMAHCCGNLITIAKCGPAIVYVVSQCVGPFRPYSRSVNSREQGVNLNKLASRCGAPRPPMTDVGTKTAFRLDQRKHFRKSKHPLRSEVS